MSEYTIEATRWVPQKTTVTFKEDLDQQLHEVRFYNNENTHTVILYRMCQRARGYMTSFAEIDQAKLTKAQHDMIAKLDCYDREEREKLINMFAAIDPNEYKIYTPATYIN